MNGKISRRVLARTIASKLLAEPERRDHWIRALGAYLIETKRVAEASLVAKEISHEILVQGGALYADVTSARPLTQEVAQQLSDFLKQATGATTVSLATHTDAELVGGFIARTPDQELDTSVRSQLRKLHSLS